MTEPALSCADCGAPMVRRRGRHGVFFGCSRYPECHGHHGAHQRTGDPLGVPADLVTRQARKAAHMYFDEIWKSGVMSRAAAYGWLRTVLGVPREKAHIALFDQKQCEQLIAACKARAAQQTSGGEEGATEK